MSNNIDLTKKIITAGHDVGNHTYYHKRMIFVTYDFVKKEIEDTDKIIRECGYKKEIFFRPPYCKKLFVLPYYLSRNDKIAVTWDIESDSKSEIANNKELILEDVEKNIKPGSIILLHPMGNKNSRAALPLIIKVVKDKGYKFVLLSDYIPK